jgi:uncharacterized membrane protein YeaQ/YmgE (transglycosylase-associated protein family)
MNLVLFLLIGLLAGWSAGKIMKGSGFGLGGNLVVGVIGALFGGFLFRILGVVSQSLLGSLIMAIVGAVVLLYIVSLVKKA